MYKYTHTKANCQMEISSLFGKGKQRATFFSPLAFPPGLSQDWVIVNLIVLAAKKKQ